MKTRFTMKRVNFIRGGVGVGLALLAGCDKQAAPSAADAASPGKPVDPSIASDTNPDCRMLNRGTARIRAGSNVPLHMLVANTGRWCFSAFGLSGQDANGSSLVNKPSSGDVRMFVQGQAVVFGYRPNIGYEGSDSFLITMPTGFGYDINLAISVTVQPPHHTPAG